MSLNLDFISPEFNLNVVEDSGRVTYLFEEYRLDVSRRMLYRGEHEVVLPPKAIETLIALIELRGEIVSKGDLMKAIWADTIVEESNVDHYLHVLRRALGEKSNGQSFIETLRRRGYRFTSDVRVIEAPDRNGKESASITANSAAFADREVEDLDRSLTSSETHTAAPGKRPSRSLPIVGAIVALSVLLGSGAFWYFQRPDSSNHAASIPGGELSVTRLTNNTFPFDATISPDGNYFVYIERAENVSRMFVQQTSQPSRVEIASSANQVFQCVTFSPDGRWIYYLVTEKESGSTLFRIPMIGGSPTKLLNGVDSPVSFSPSGKEIAFSRRASFEDTAILIADRDGRGERILVQRRGLVAVGSNAAWSPDGKAVVYSEVDITTAPAVWRLNIVDIATGIVKPFSDENWANTFRIEWLRDGSGIVLTGTRAGDGLSALRDQVYFVSYPEGISRRITSDGNLYEANSLGITRDGAIIAIPSNRSSQIWSMRSNGDMATAVQITRGLADGRGGLVTLPDGRIAYIARTSVDLTVWIANGDGSNAKQLSTGYQFLEELRADATGKYLIFSAPKDSLHHLFRIDINGGEVKQLTFGESQEVDSTVSPDGKVIVTHSQAQGALSGGRLKMIPIEGGALQPMDVSDCGSPVFSPDGSMLSCIEGEKVVLVLNASDGREIDRVQLPPPAVANFGALWTPDGSGLVVVTSESGVSNLMVFPRDRRPPFKLTNFSSDIIYRFAFSTDGSRLFIARGNPMRGVILIQNWR